MEAIISFFSSLINFIVTQVKSIIWVSSAIDDFGAVFSSLFAYCPTFLLVFLEASLALTILFAIFKLL